MAKITPKVIMVTVALALFLWASFNTLDLVVNIVTGDEQVAMFIVFTVVQIMTILVLIYYGAEGKLLKR